MAQKRAAEHMENITKTKFLKQIEENDDDVILDTSVLSSDFTSSLEYDCLLQTFSVTLEKQHKDGHRCVCFGDEELKSIVNFLPVIEKLICKYSQKRSPKPLDIPFEACKSKTGDIVTVVSLKENSYKRGHFDVDIRKCVKREDGSYMYTTEGVRVTWSLITQLKENLLKYQSHISSATDKTKEVISIITAHVIILEMNELTDPRQNCHGCQIQHPSQTEHMAEGGCLSADQPTWGELCDQYYQAAKNLIKEESIQSLAKRAVACIPELQVCILLLLFMLIFTLMSSTSLFIAIVVKKLLP